MGKHSTPDHCDSSFTRDVTGSYGEIDYYNANGSLSQTVEYDGPFTRVWSLEGFRNLWVVEAGLIVRTVVGHESADI